MSLRTRYIQHRKINQKQQNDLDTLPKADLWIRPCRYRTGYTLSCLLVGLVENSAILVFLCLPSSLFDFSLLLVTVTVCFRQLLLLGPLSLFQCSSLALEVMSSQWKEIFTRVANLNKNMTMRCNNFIFSNSYDE